MALSHLQCQLRHIQLQRFGRNLIEGGVKAAEHSGSLCTGGRALRHKGEGSVALGHAVENAAGLQGAHRGQSPFRDGGRVGKVDDGVADKGRH